MADCFQVVTTWKWRGSRGGTGASPRNPYLERDEAAFDRLAMARELARRRLPLGDRRVQDRTENRADRRRDDQPDARGRARQPPARCDRRARLFDGGRYRPKPARECLGVALHGLPETPFSEVCTDELGGRRLHDLPDAAV